MKVTLSRKVAFSSGHRYWIESLDESENRKLFGQWASPYNHGHNYVLWVSVEGDVNPADGMVVNIKDVDAVLQREVVAVFDQKSINDEVPPFGQIVPSTENLTRHIQHRLTDLPKGAALTKLRLEETSTLWCELETETDMLTITRTYEFAASHRLHVEEFSAEQNREAFGKCNNAAGHGHNYGLEVTVTGDPDPVTGFIVDIGRLDSVVNQEVVDRYDHKNLNCDVPELAGKNPTSEVVAIAIFDRLKSTVPCRLVKVRLLETARNAFEVSG